MLEASVAIFLSSFFFEFIMIFVDIIFVMVGLVMVGLVMLVLVIA